MLAFIDHYPVAFTALVTSSVAIATLIVNAWVNAALAKRKAVDEALLAERKAEIERREREWTRRSDFAEQLVADFSEFRSRIAEIRDPGAFSHEMDRDGRDDESPLVRRTRDAYWPTYERLGRNTAFLENLHAKRHRARALYGPAAETPFLEMWSLVCQLRNALSPLLRLHEPAAAATPAERIVRWEETIWSESVEGQPDEFDRRCDDVLRAADTLFGAFLSHGPTGR